MRVSFIKGEIDLLKQASIYDYVVASSSHSLSGTGSFASYIANIGGDRLKEAKAGKKSCNNGMAYIIPGESVGIHAVVYAMTPTKGTNSFKDLVDCYFDCIKAINQHLETTKFSKANTVAFSLLGTGKLGWSVEESAEAFRQSVFLFIEDCIAGSNNQRIERLQLFFNNKGSDKLIEAYRNRRSHAFLDYQGGWGLRGDPHYWLYLMRHFDNPVFNNLNLGQFIEEINHTSIKLCGKPIAKVNCEYVEQFDHGGMSRGMISDFWIDKGIETLCLELCKLSIDNEPKPIIFVNTVISNKNWLLPYTVIEKLQELIRSS